MKGIWTGKGTVVAFAIQDRPWISQVFRNFIYYSCIELFFVLYLCRGQDWELRFINEDSLFCSQAGRTVSKSQKVKMLR